MIKKIYLLLVLLSFSQVVAAHTRPAEPDTSVSLIGKGVIATKMTEAKNRLYKSDYRGALNTFREVLTEDARYAPAHYYIAECYFGLMNYDYAKTSLDKALELDPKVNKESLLLQGKIHHRLGQIDQALEYLEQWKQSNPNHEEATYLIQQCNSAKTLMAAPLPVKISNAGDNVNSRDDDYAPIPSPDGKTLYFTSRRPQSLGGLKAVDRSNYEDIYFSKLDEEQGWEEAEKLPGGINTDGHDNCSHLSADGETMYVTQNIAKQTRSSDIGISKLSRSGKWGKVKLLPKSVINTSYFDACPTLSVDERTMYFVSERNGEKYGSEIFKSIKTGSTWETPLAVAILNSPEDETTPFLHPSGKWLFFSSKGHNSMGGYDIFVSEWTGLTWGEPRNLGYPINSVNDDTHFRVSADGRYGYFSSVRPDSKGGRDIYIVDLSEIDWLK